MARLRIGLAVVRTVDGRTRNAYAGDGLGDVIPEDIEKLRRNGHLTEDADASTSRGDDQVPGQLSVDDMLADTDEDASDEDEDTAPESLDEDAVEAAVELLEAEKPNGGDTVKLAVGDPAKAAVLAEAERRTRQARRS